MNRRNLLRAMALGGGLVAGELWWPGKRLISIPKAPEFWTNPSTVWLEGALDINGEFVWKRLEPNSMFRPTCAGIESLWYDAPQNTRTILLPTISPQTVDNQEESK